MLITAALEVVSTSRDIMAGVMATSDVIDVHDAVLLDMPPSETDGVTLSGANRQPTNVTEDPPVTAKFMTARLVDMPGASNVIDESRAVPD
jgi:hypothetical protein